MSICSYLKEVPNSKNHYGAILLCGDTEELTVLGVADHFLPIKIFSKLILTRFILFLDKYQ